MTMTTTSGRSGPPWAAVDDYFNTALSGEDEALAAARRASAQAGLPDISVSAAEGKLLHLLARAAGARRILEVGTLGGYSTIWLARAITRPGQLIALEVNPHHAEVATANLDRAGVGDLADVRVGPAADSLEALTSGGAEPFDFVFIDADKPNNARYFDYAVRLSHPGTVIVVDNVVYGGEVLEPGSSTAASVGPLVDWIAAHDTVDAVAVQTVGVRGYDGIIVAVVGSQGADGN
jgi:predicted O-methyltransferase YrrM